jgi:hypothetical protein
MYSNNDEPTKSFNELQSDILGEKLTSNPLMTAHKLVGKNKALNTKQKTIVNAINEVLATMERIEAATDKDLKSMYSYLGSFNTKPTLINELSSRDADSVLSLAMKAYDDVQEIKDIAKDDYEDVFHVGEGETQSVFKLSYKPIGKIRMYIDGIRYFHDCISYNAETNEVTWINDSSKTEGFDITDADVVFEYDCIKE